MANRTGTAYYLIGVLLTTGCVEQTTAPRQPLLATVATKLTIYGQGGEVRQQFDYSQTVRAQFTDGVARPVAAGSLLRSSVSVAGSGRSTWSVDSTSSTTPILIAALAVVPGTFSYNYDQTTIDSTGNAIHMVATGPTDGSPVTDAYGYVNGKLATYDRSSWQYDASGVYILKSQVLNGYDSTGTLVASVFSAVTATTVPTRTFTSTGSDLGVKLAAVSREALNRAWCALAPNVAFAATSPCLHSGLVFAGETLGLGIATGIGIASDGVVLAVWGTGYVTGWALWTDAMYGFLQCLNSSGGGKPRLQPIQKQ